jgi:hypothetical protein
MWRVLGPLLLILWLIQHFIYIDRVTDDCARRGGDYNWNARLCLKRDAIIK